jgi:ribonuclease P protein component
MLPQQHRLRTASEFGYALRSGTRFGNRNLVIFLADRASPADPTIVGFLVSKKVGNAVVRNRVKRRLREMSADVVKRHPQGLALVIRALPSSSSLDYADLSREFSSALRGCQAKAERRRT